MPPLSPDIQVMITDFLKTEPALDVIPNDPLRGERHFYRYQFHQAGITYHLTIEPLDDYYDITLRLTSGQQSEPLAEIVLECDQIVLNEAEFIDDSIDLVFQARRIRIPDDHLAMHWLRISITATGFDVGSYYIAEYPQAG
jgi:hypothetical protein